MKIAFIGSGRMAEALIARLARPKDIIAADIDRRRLRQLRSRYGIKTTPDNLEAFRQGSVVILAVKPQQMAEVLSGLARYGANKLVISIAAGIPTGYLQKKLPKAKIIRAMPNNPCMVGAGITALAKGKKVTGQELRVARRIFEAVGEVVEIPERFMDAVTGLSGSGPAFVYLVTEALTAGGVAAGLPAKVAERLAVQTVLGAAATVKQTARTPQELRAMVTSPGGTTLEGLAVLEKRRVLHALRDAVLAAAKKSKVLSKRWAR